MSVSGFKVEGVVEKYNYPDLDNIDVQTAHIHNKAVTAEKLGDDVVEILDNKANLDGSYDNLTSGAAKTLLSTVGIEDSTPYNFRTSGGSTEIGDREELNAVVGGTIAWNQGYNKGGTTATGGGVTYTNNGDGSWTLTNNGTDTNRKLIQNVAMTSGHVIMLRHGASIDGDGAFCVCLSIDGAYITESYKARGNIFKIGYAFNQFSIRTFSGFTPPSGSLVLKPQWFDLTAMLGSTIADYIYALEQSNAGAGVAYFRKLFPKPYYAYNSSEMLSVRTNLHRTVGFNLLDKSKAVNGKRFNSTGITNIGSSFSRSDWIRVMPSTSYYFKDIVGYSDMAAIFWYDADKNYLSANFISGASPKSGYFTSPENAYYVGVNFRTVDIDSVCVSLRWDGERDGEYEPYVAHEYALSDITLRGVLKLDANNNLYADGDRYLPDGTVIRKRRQIVADGDTVKATSVSQSNGTYYCVLTALSSANKSVNSTTTETRIITDKGYRDCAGVGVGHIYITGNGLTPVICLFDQTLTTVSAVNTYLASNPITIEYELATPTTESADPYQQTQIVDDFGTEEFVDAAVEANERDVAIPVGHTTFYQANLKAKLEMMPDSPDGAGDYIMRSDGSEQTWVPLIEVKELPDVPTTDGTYVLKCTVSDGTATLTWVSE